jgi:hypothetical protein
MKDTKKVEYTVSTLLDIVDSLMTVIDAKMGNYFIYPESKLLHECQAVMKDLKHNWQDEF